MPLGPSCYRVRPIIARTFPLDDEIAAAPVAISKPDNNGSASEAHCPARLGSGAFFVERRSIFVLHFACKLLRFQCDELRCFGNRGRFPGAVVGLGRYGADKLGERRDDLSAGDAKASPQEFIE